MLKWQNKCIFLTGASGGLGQALAYALAAQGVTLILCAKTKEKLEKLYDGIIASGGPAPFAYPLDLETLTPAVARQTAHAIAREVGHLDALIHTAAYVGGLCPIAHMVEAEWHKVLAINLHGPVFLSQGLLPLIQRSQGAILWTLDRTLPTEPTAYWGAYAVAKAGLAHIAGMLQAECQHPAIYSQGIHPGPMRTALRRQAFPGEIPSTIPLPESMVPLYLAHLEAAFSGAPSAPKS